MFIANFRLKTFVQKMLCDLQEILDFPAMHPAREIQRIAFNESVKYIKENMRSALGVSTARQVFEIALREARVEGHFLEFGVFKGGTIRFVANQIGDKLIHGFDSFEGLPENWSGYNLAENMFDLGGKLPKIQSNVRLHKGWFDETLPKWLQENPGPVGLLHVDCDLYSSTKVIFDLLAPRIIAGTVIVFDEYLNYPNWQEHEFKAFHEFVEQYHATYEYIAYARIQVAVKVTSIEHAASARAFSP